jgi:hypothetical protein
LRLLSLVLLRTSILGTFSRIRAKQTASTGYGRSTESVRFRPQGDETRQICQQRSCTVVYLDHCLFNYLGVCEIEPREDESSIDAGDRMHAHGEQRPLSNTFGTRSIIFPGHHFDIPTCGHVPLDDSGLDFRDWP